MYFTWDIAVHELNFHESRSFRKICENKVLWIYKTPRTVLTVSEQCIIDALHYMNKGLHWVFVLCILAHIGKPIQTAHHSKSIKEDS